MKVVGISGTAHRLTHRGNTITQRRVGCIRSRACDDVRARFLEELENRRADYARRTHFRADHGWSKISLLDLKADARARKKAADGLLRGKRHAHINAAVRCVLVSSPSSSRCGMTKSSQFRLAKVTNETSQILIIQICDVIGSDFEHAQQFRKLKLICQRKPHATLANPRSTGWLD